MELTDVLKVFGPFLLGIIVSRAFKGSDDVTELKVKVAMLTERIEGQDRRITTVDNRAAAAFTKIDKVRSKMRQDSGKDDQSDG